MPALLFVVVVVVACDVVTAYVDVASAFVAADPIDATTACIVDFVDATGAANARFSCYL